MQWEIKCEVEDGCDVGECGTFSWMDKHEDKKMTGCGQCIQEIGKITGMDGIAYLIEIDPESVDFAE